MSKLNLRSRLFLSHVAVMAVGIITLISIGRFYSPRLFVVYIEQINGLGPFSVRQVRTELVQGFERAWTRGMLLSIIVGGGAAGGLSYWLSRRIVQPLVQIEESTQRLAAGHLEERVPPSEIPELHQLAISFNRMAAELEGVEQRRRDLVSDLTHELRTPLTVVEGYLEGLADGTIDSDPEIYDRLARETKRLRRLVNDLQELSKMEAGYLPIDAKPMDVCPLLSVLVERFETQVLDPDRLALELNCPANLPLVLADAERVEQILVNLIGNALRHTAEGQITVTAWAEPPLLWIAVQDTGEGIDPEHLPYVFERFWRADRSRDRASGGTGIGLAICRRLVELQGGTIHVDSQPGAGSTFQFSLPLAAKM
jgi:signal transduction histidine kinase